MNVFLKSKKNLTFCNKLLRFVLLPILVAVCALLISCKKTVNRFDSVSEIRSNILLASSDEFSLRIYIGEREVPYSADGVARETSPRFDAYMVAPNGTKTYNFHFKIGGETYGGEMSYDNVKGEYYYFCSLAVGQLDELSCEISYDEERIVLTAKSVLTEQTLSPKQVLQKLEELETDFFASLTDRYGFAGEIYVRLIFEDKPYYYVGVIDRKGNASAFLLNAETGKLLAKRTK